MDKPPESKVAPYSAKPAGLAAPAVPVPAIVRTSRGISNNVQQAYANWQRGMRKQGG